MPPTPPQPPSRTIQECIDQLRITNANLIDQTDVLKRLVEIGKTQGWVTSALEYDLQAVSYVLNFLDPVHLNEALSGVPESVRSYHFGRNLFNVVYLPRPHYPGVAPLKLLVLRQLSAGVVY
jgi:hypothetical protein